MNRRRSSAGQRLASWPLLGSVYRIAVTIEETLPVARSGLRLVRAEARLARESVPPLLWSAVAALFGLWIMLGALAAGTVMSLTTAGWPLGWAVSLPAAAGFAVLLVGGFFAWRGIERLTFAESRARLHALLEVIDED